MDYRRLIHVYFKNLPRIGIAVCLVLLLQNTGYAAAPDSTRVTVPEEFKSGDECPPLRNGMISICGQVRSAIDNEVDDVQRRGAYVKGLTVAAYMGASSLGMSDMNHTGAYDGYITGLFAYTETNVDGEFALPVARGGVTGSIYLAFLCGSKLVDLYMLDASRDISKMRISVGTPLECTPYVAADANGIPAPPYLDYLDRDAFWCLGADGGDPGYEPSADVEAEIHLYDRLHDEHWVTGDSPTGPTDTNLWLTRSELIASLPEHDNLSRADLEGFTDSWMAYSVDAISSLNCGLGGCYYTDPLEGSGYTPPPDPTQDELPMDTGIVPSCEVLKKCSSFPRPAECRTPGLDLSSPASWEQYLEILIRLREGIGGMLWNDIPVCDGYTLGDFVSVRTRQVEVNGEEVTELVSAFLKDVTFEDRGVEKTYTFPASVLFNPYYNSFLAISFENRTTNDTYRNMTSEEIVYFILDNLAADGSNAEFLTDYGWATWPDGSPRPNPGIDPDLIVANLADADDCFANSVSIGRSRIDASQILDSDLDVIRNGTKFAELPFKTCYKSRLPVQETYSAQRAMLLGTPNSFYENEEKYSYDPVVAFFAAPGETVGQEKTGFFSTVINPALQYDRVGAGYWRLGTARALCTGNAADFHTHYGFPWNNVRESYHTPLDTDDSVLYGFPSAYKFSTTSAVEDGNILPGEVVPGVLADTVIAHGDGDRLKGTDIYFGLRMVGDNVPNDLTSVFPVNVTNWEEHLCIADPPGATAAYYNGAGGDDCCIEWRVNCVAPHDRLPGQSCDVFNTGSGNCCEGADEDGDGDGDSDVICSGPYDEDIPIYWGEEFLGTQHNGGHCVALDEFNAYEYRYECVGYTNYNAEISSDIQNHPVGDSSYGARLVAGMLQPPYQDCAEGGLCDVHNTYLLDVRAENTFFGEPKQGYGIPVLGEGAPGEVYYMDQLRAAMSVNFETDGEAGDLNDSFVLGDGNLNSCSDMEEPSPPPSTGQIDILPYLKGDGRVYYLEYCFDGQRGVQTLQTQNGDTDSSRGIFFQVKDGQFETLYYDSDQIYRELDTSEAVDRFYMQHTRSGVYVIRGAPWIDRFMSSGQTTGRNPFVQHYEDKAACTELHSGDVPSSIKFYGEYPTFTFPNGVSLSNVIALGWDDGGTMQEYYFYALNYGLVGFWGRGMGASYYAGDAAGHGGLTREPICIGEASDLNTLYFE